MRDEEKASSFFPLILYQIKSSLANKAAAARKWHDNNKGGELKFIRTAAEKRICLFCSKFQTAAAVALACQ